jgi:hypothetical protein
VTTINTYFGEFLRQARRVIVVTGSLVGTYQTKIYNWCQNLHMHLIFCKIYFCLVCFLSTEGYKPYFGYIFLKPFKPYF